VSHDTGSARRFRPHTWPVPDDAPVLRPSALLRRLVVVDVVSLLLGCGVTGVWQVEAKNRASFEDLPPARPVLRRQLAGGEVLAVILDALHAVGARSCGPLHRPALFAPARVGSPVPFARTHRSPSVTRQARPAERSRPQCTRRARSSCRAAVVRSQATPSLTRPTGFMLPRGLCYFDDIVGEDHVLQNDFEANRSPFGSSILNTPEHVYRQSTGPKAKRALPANLERVRSPDAGN
jgi:hypothetical protein